jgi:heterotetrameric sarcosine oxidase gamma subunit
VSCEFLSVDAAVPAGGRTPLGRSPMERAARRAGARFAVRDGWNVAVGYAGDGSTTGWTDVSHLGKLELQAGDTALAEIVARCAGGAELEPGAAARAGEAWWCPLTRTRALVVCPAAETAGLRERLEQAAAAAPGYASVVDVTTGFAALAISGPAARELLARVSGLDLRPRLMPVGAFRPGSLARTPGLVLRVADDRYLALVGAALGEYLWTVVADAGAALGGRPLGVDAHA